MDKPCSWGELNHWANTLAGNFPELPFHEAPSHPFAATFQGRAFVHSVENTVEDILIALACPIAGRVEVAIDATGGAGYIADCETTAGATSVPAEWKREWVHHAKRTLGSPSVQPAQLHGDQDALVLFTSGTAGRPKGVRLSHRALVHNAAAKLAAVPQYEHDHRLTVLSIAHAYARTCDLGTWLLSGCTLEIGRGYQAWTEAEHQAAPTLCNMVPSLASRILGEGPHYEELRVLGCGGAAMTVDNFSGWKDRDVTVIQGYGLTEAGPVIASQTPANSIPSRVGRFVSGWEHRIDEGRLFVRGPHLMNGYLGDLHPAADSRAAEIRTASNRLDRNGWLDTGDLVRLWDDSGQLEILGRCDDRFALSNGHLIDPAAIEKRIMSLPGIRAAIVAASADRRRLCWWIESEDGTRFPALAPALQRIAGELANWNRPKQVLRFSVPEAERDRVFNHKGAIRRQALLNRIEDFRLPDSADVTGADT